MKTFNAGAWALVAAVAAAGIAPLPVVLLVTFDVLGEQTAAPLVLVVAVVSGVATFRMLRRRAEKHSD